MLRILKFLIAVCYSTIGNGQATTCPLSDTTSTGGQILQRLQKSGIAGLTITNRRTGKKFQGYRVCEQHSIQIDSLTQILSGVQIDSLLECNNGTLKTIGFILYVRKHNDKKSVIDKFVKLLNEDYIVMTRNCSDAIQMSSVGRICYDFITTANIFFKPTFKLTKNEMALLEIELRRYELPMTKNTQ